MSDMISDITPAVDVAGLALRDGVGFDELQESA